MQQTQNDATAWRVTGPEIMDTDHYLSSNNAPDIEEDVRLCVASGAREMILNCAGLTYMTGAGMRAFINIARMMQQVGGTLSVSGLKGQPRDMFEACGMDAMIPLTDDMPSLSVVQSA